MPQPLAMVQESGPVWLSPKIGRHVEDFDGLGGPPAQKADILATPP